MQEPRPTKSQGILTLVGDWGFTQRYTFCCLQYAMIMLSWQTLNITFLSPPVDHTCILTEQGPVTNNEKLMTCKSSPLGNESSLPCLQWNYTRELFQSTLTEKYDLVCDRKWISSFFKSLFMFGALLMSPIAGMITDRFGRRTASLITSVPIIFGNALILFNTNIFMIMLGQFLDGVSAGCALNSISVLFMELTEGRRRYAMLASMDLGFATGSVLLGLVSWALRDWFHIQIVGLTLACLPLVLAWFLPESPAWLILNKKFDKAQKSISQIAKWNGKNLTSLENKIHELSKTLQNKPNDSDIKGGFLALFSSTSRLKRTILIMYCRFSSGVVYYGIVMNVKFFGENLFTDFLLSATLAVPSVVVAIILVRHVSMRTVLIGCTALEAVVCSVFAVVLGLNVKVTGVHTSLIVLAWLFAAPSMPVSIQFTAELYPIIVRGTATGLGFFVTRLGGLVSVYCKELGESTSLFVPVLLFGALSATTVVSLVLLPDVTSKKLQKTTKEDKSKETLSHKRRNGDDIDFDKLTTTT